MNLFLMDIIYLVVPFIVSICAIIYSYKKTRDSKEDFLICPYCGHKTPIDSLFCEFCGKNLQLLASAPSNNAYEVLGLLSLIVGGVISIIIGIYEVFISSLPIDYWLLFYGINHIVICFCGIAIYIIFKLRLNCSLKIGFTSFFKAKPLH